VGSAPIPENPVRVYFTRLFEEHYEFHLCPAFWTLINVTTSIWTFAAHHLLHFFSLYRSYLPPVMVIIAVPIVIVGEDVLY